MIKICYKDALVDSNFSQHDLKIYLGPQNNTWFPSTSYSFILCEVGIEHMPSIYCSHPTTHGYPHHVLTWPYGNMVVYSSDMSMFEIHHFNFLNVSSRRHLYLLGVERWLFNVLGLILLLDLIDGGGGRKCHTTKRVTTCSASPN